MCCPCIVLFFLQCLGIKYKVQNSGPGLVNLGFLTKGVSPSSVVSTRSLLLLDLFRVPGVMPLFRFFRVWLPSLRDIESFNLRTAVGSDEIVDATFLGPFLGDSAGRRMASLHNFSFHSDFYLSHCLFLDNITIVIKIILQIASQQTSAPFSYTSQHPMVEKLATACSCVVS